MPRPDLATLSDESVSAVFSPAHFQDPVLRSMTPQFSAERNTPGIFGAGAMQMLGEEMSLELQNQVPTLPDGWHTLTTKGVDFEAEIIGGDVINAIGVATTLDVDVFGATGGVLRIRNFSKSAFLNHHDMEPEESIDLEPGIGPDFDGDGVTRELTIGDITAISIFQAALAMLGRTAAP